LKPPAAGRYAVMLMLIFLATGRRAQAEDLDTCFQTHPDPNPCMNYPYQFQRLSSMEKAAQVPGLIAMLQRGMMDSSRETDMKSRTAANALVYAGAESKDYVPTLISLFSVPDENKKMRGYARQVLSAIGPDAVPALRQALSSPDPNVRGNAAGALAWIHPVQKETIDDLVRLLDDPSEDVRNQILMTLSGMGGEGGMAAQKWRAAHQTPFQPVQSIKDPADALKQLDELIGYTKSADPKERDYGVLHLMQWKAGGIAMSQGMDSAMISKAATAIIGTLKDPDPQVRARAVTAIGYFQQFPGEARPYYLDALTDSDEKVRAGGIAGMASIRPPDPGLERLLLDLLDKEFSAHPENYLNGVNSDSVYWQGLQALNGIGTPISLQRVADMQNEFNTRYAEKQRLDQQKADTERQREFESMFHLFPNWSIYLIRGLFLLWMVVYIIRYPPNTRWRSVFWLIVFLFVIWKWYRGHERLLEIQERVETTSPSSTPPKPLITF
jgi:HEAT repeat protein